MLDALIFAVRDGVRSAGFGYGYPQCELTGPDGRPPPRMGDLFVSVYGGSSHNTAVRNLDERFGFCVTLTMRVSGVPLDRIGDVLLASKLARTTGKGMPSFNARCEQLRKYLHMNWPITVQTGQMPASANDNLVAWCPSDVSSVYGFVEPAHYTGEERPQLVGPDWFSAEPGNESVGLKAELKFEGARRMQPQTQPVGPYV